MLHEFLAEQSGEAVALIAGEDRWTFGELARWSSAVAELARGDAKAGETIAIVGDNSPAYLACLYGIPQGDRVVSMVNQRLSRPEMLAQLADSAAVALWGDGTHLDALAADLPPSVRTTRRFDELVALSASDGPFVDAPAGDVAVGDDASGAAQGDAATAWLIYTSGTTGRAKGAMLTHQSIVAAVEASVSGRPVLPDDVYLFPFSLCHVAAYNVFIQHRFGRPVVLVPGFDAAEVLALVPEHRVSTISLAPTMMAMLLDHADFDPAALGTLRLVGYGSAPIAEPLLRRWLAALACGVSQGYGMTELSGNAAFLTAADHERALDDRPDLLRATGRAAQGVELRIAADGEILVRARQVMAGYWRDAAATAQTIVDEWLHTGDLGRIDDDGYLYVVDRKKDIIVSGGENVSSREVEDAIRTAPGIADVAVVGVPDDRWGEAVCAVVVASRAVDATDLVDHVRTQLAGYKKPRHVLRIDQLPRNGAGKVLKRDLRTWATTQLAPEQSGEG